MVKKAAIISPLFFGQGFKCATEPGFLGSAFFGHLLRKAARYLTADNCPGVKCPESNVQESNVGQPFKDGFLKSGKLLSKVYYTAKLGSLSCLRPAIEYIEVYSEKFQD